MNEEKETSKEALEVLAKSLNDLGCEVVKAAMSKQLRIIYWILGISLLVAGIYCRVMGSDNGTWIYMFLGFVYITAALFFQKANKKE